MEGAIENPTDTNILGFSEEFVINLSRIFFEEWEKISNWFGWDT